MRRILLSRPLVTAAGLRCATTARQPLLSDIQVEQFHRDGYVVVDNLFPADQLRDLGNAVRNAALKRGARYLPESDKQHKQNSVQFEATLHEAMPADQRHRLAPDGTNEATFERRERRIKIQCRNRKEMERAYKKIAAMREQYSQYKGVNLQQKKVQLEDSVPTSPSPSPPSSHAHSEAPPQQQFVKVAPQSRQQTNNEGFSHNADDDVDVQSFNKEKAKQSFETYRDSGKMEKDIRKGSHLDEAFAHVYNGAQSWIHVWPRDTALRDAVFRGKPSTGSQAQLPSVFNGSVASCVGSIGAQLAGVMTTRMYTDSIIQRTPFCNPLPFHHDSSGLNYRDPRGLLATIVLGGSVQPLDDNHGGYVVLPGSHQVIRTLTNDCRDQTGFVRPTAWELGEALRAYPQLLKIEPRSLGELKPGSVLFISNMLVYSNGPNMCINASPAGREMLYSDNFKMALAKQSSPSAGMALSGDDDGNNGPSRAELFMYEAPITYSMSVMPDGVFFDGVRNTWMSKDSHGPLFKL